MNIHEYQGKQVLKGYGLPVAEGVAITSADEAEAAAKSLPGPLYVVKSQIHAGGRGKGRFKELGPDAKGGVRLAFSIEDVVKNAREMLGSTLVTAQTGPAGKQVNRLYIEDGADIARELYLSLLVDRDSGKVAFVASTEGGMDIEAVAHDTPEKIITLPINPETGVTADDVKALNTALKLDGAGSEIQITRPGTDLQVGKLVFVGDRLSRSGEQCRYEAPGAPLKLSTKESGAGLRRYEVDFPGCAFTFDGKICLICTVGSTFGGVHTLTISDAPFSVATLFDWHVIVFSV